MLRKQFGEKGKFKLGRKTAKDRYRWGITKINKWLKGVQNVAKLEEWWKVLGCKLIRHYRYYVIIGNMGRIKGYYFQVIRLAYKWINRRSQKRSYCWERFNRFLKFNPLPKPRIYHPYPVLV